MLLGWGAGLLRVARMMTHGRTIKHSFISSNELLCACALFECKGIFHVVFVRACLNILTSPWKHNSQHVELNFIFRCLPLCWVHHTLYIFVLLVRGGTFCMLQSSRGPFRRWLTCIGLGSTITSSGI